MAQTFVAHDERFRSILGSNPMIDLIAQNDEYPFAHEAGVFIDASDELFITSSRFNDKKTNELRIQITKVLLGDRKTNVTLEEVDSSKVPMGNGGVNYGDDSVLFCAQGSHILPSGLYKMSVKPPHEVSLVISHYHNRPFNSVNDVVIHSDGSIWFTDPTYGYEQGYRPRPRLPSQVYRYDPNSKGIRAMADGLGHPNGICFSPDEKTVYITDTDWYHGDGTSDDSKASTIYAYDVATYHGEPFLVNKRLFAMADVGIPDGIKCDMDGNVYSGCWDGVNVWSPGGVLLGRVAVEGGAANFCFGRSGEMFLLNEHKLWRAQLGSHVRGALLGI